MTEICSKSEAKLTEGIKGLTNNPDSEGSDGMFDALFGIVSDFGVVSEEEIDIEPETALFPSNLTLPTTEPDKKVQNAELFTIMSPDGQGFNGNPSSKTDNPIRPRPNWMAQDPSTGLNNFKLTLEIQDDNVDGNTETNFLNKLAAVVKRGPEIGSDKSKGPVLEQNNLKNMPILDQAKNEGITHKDDAVASHLLKNTYQKNSSLLNNTQLKPEKVKYEIPQIGTEEINEKSSGKGLQLPKLAQTTPNKELLKADTGQSASVTNSNSNSTTSNNGNSGGNLGSGNTSHTNSSTILEHLNMLDKSWSKNLLNKLQTALQNGQESIELALKPKNLGKLRIALSLNNEGAKINIVTETSSAALLLAESEGKLSQMLEGSGLKLSNLNTSSEQEKKGTPDQSSNGKNDNENQLEKQEADQEKNDPSTVTMNSLNQTINLIA